MVDKAGHNFPHTITAEEYRRQREGEDIFYVRHQPRIVDAE